MCGAAAAAGGWRAGGAAALGLRLPPPRRGTSAGPSPPTIRPATIHHPTVAHMHPYPALCRSYVMSGCLSFICWQGDAHRIDCGGNYYQLALRKAARNIVETAKYRQQG
ncbi:Hypothetical protein NTJ_03131 [Nesidiocoris tenuis]|uniref:Uncharacterized protein n=1 Tax=Nesidiocoris tenuis TaxID=355587 RepID=A0ABN7AE97_9HEMI|nr:Hypothetical protein NTJ_03131 [Nesidiocoris tenuis]